MLLVSPAVWRCEDVQKIYKKRESLKAYKVLDKKGSEYYHTSQYQKVALAAQRRGET